MILVGKKYKCTKPTYMINKTKNTIKMNQKTFSIKKETY